MPDIKTALESALMKTANAWAADDAPHQAIQQTITPQENQVNTIIHHNVTTNVTRATFELIASNPVGITRPEAMARLIAKGYKANSVSSLIGQMLTQRLVREVEGYLFANQKEYTPLKPALAKLTNGKRAQRTGTPRPRPQWVAPAEAAPTPSTTDVTALIDSMSIKQARAVYDELKKIFGAH